MTRPDLIDRVFQSTFAPYLDYAKREITTFRETFLRGDVKDHLQQHYQVEVIEDGDSIAFKTPLGRVAIEFAPSLDGKYLAFTAVFCDTNPADEKRDLYAVRLNWDRGWQDITGMALDHDHHADAVGSLGYVQMIQRVLAQKLRLSEHRLASLASELDSRPST